MLEHFDAERAGLSGGTVVYNSLPITMRRVVVAVDPSGTAGNGVGDGIGIVVAGLGIDGRFYVLEDASCHLSPEQWSRRVVAAYHEHKADRIIAEANFGGAMVEAVIRVADPRVSYRAVHASRGKIARAEPIAALYEKGRVSHAGTFPELEDQLANMTPAGFVGEGSPTGRMHSCGPLPNLDCNRAAASPFRRGEMAGAFLGWKLVAAQARGPSTGERMAWWQWLVVRPRDRFDARLCLLSTQSGHKPMWLFVPTMARPGVNYC